MRVLGVHDDLVVKSTGGGVRMCVHACERERGEERGGERGKREKGRRERGGRERARARARACVRERQVVVRKLLKMLAKLSKVPR